MLYRIGAGELCSLSVVAARHGIPFPAHVTSERAARIRVLEREGFLGSLERDPRMRALTLSAFSRHLLEALALLEQTAFGGLEGRIMHALRRHAGTASGRRAIAITHEQLARETGSAREAVSRMLKALERSGRVRLLRGRIELLERPPRRQTP